MRPTRLARGDKGTSALLYAEAREAAGKEWWSAMSPKDSFRPGKYKHYKGGHYSAIMLVLHHETREPMVVYVSQEKGNVQVRELMSCEPWTSDKEKDAWTDIVEWPDGEKRPRFVFVEDFK